MYRFRPNNEPGVIDTRDGAVIPPDAIGYRWREYLDWMNAGNEAAAADVLPEYVPPMSKLTVISKLNDFELEQLETMRQTRPLRERLMWETAQEVDPRNSMLIAFFTEVIGEARTKEVFDLP